MRPYLLASALLVAGATSLAAVTSCDSPDTCMHLTCSNGAAYVGHVQAPLAVVEGSTVTLCVNDVCGAAQPFLASGVDAGAADASAPAVDAAADAPGADDAGPDGGLADAVDASPSPEAGASPDAGAAPITSDPSAPLVAFTLAGALSGSGQLIPEPDGWVLVSVTPTSFATVNGDRYRMTVTAPDGTTLLDVTRGVKYSDFYPNGQECPATHCQQGVINAWPTSPSNLTCSANDIYAAAYFTLLPKAIQTGSTLRVCRNDICDVDTAFVALAPTDDYRDGRMAGPLFVGYELSFGGTQLDLTVGADPAVLTNGDRYTVTLTDPLGVTQENVATTATYLATVPNEPGCDPYPIRTASYSQ